MFLGTFFPPECANPHEKQPLEQLNSLLFFTAALVSKEPSPAPAVLSAQPLSMLLRALLILDTSF